MNNGKQQMEAAPSALSKAMLGVAGSLFVLGQLAMFGGRVGLGLGLSFCALLLLGALLTYPALAARRVKAGKGGSAGGREVSQRQGLVADPKLPRAAWGHLLSQWSAKASRWKPSFQDTLELPRWLMVLPAALAAAGAQWGMLRGKTTLPVLLLAIAGIFIWAFVQGLGRPLFIRNINHNLKALFLAALGLPLLLFGSYLMWQYVHVMSGFVVTIAGGSWSLYALSRWPLRLASPEEEASADDDLSAPPQASFFTADVWQLKTWLLLGAAICAFLSMRILPNEYPLWSVITAFLGMALVIGSFPWLPRPLPKLLGLPAALQAFAALCGALAAVWLGYQGQMLIQANQISLGLWWFLAAGVVGVLVLPVRSPGLREQVEEALPPRWVEGLLMLGLLVTAFAFRFWKVGIFPYAAEGDEAGGGMWATDAIFGPIENHLIHANVPLHFFSITGSFFKYFDLSMTTLRMHSVIFGTLSVVAVYLFLRFFAGWVAALVATVLMAFSYWHLHYSRFGHYNIEQVFAQMVAFYFIFKAIRTRSYWRAVVGGAAFGLAMLPHLASRLLPFQGLLLLLLYFLTSRAALRRHANLFVAFVLTSYIVASPALMYWFKNTWGSFGRASSVSIFDKTNTNAPVDVVSGFVRNSKVSMLMFNHTSDTRSRNNPVAPDRILETWTAILFAIAFAYALYHWRHPARFFLLGAFFINLSASIFSVEAPQTLRTAGNISIVFCLIGLWLGDLSHGLGGLGRKQAAWLLLAIALPAAGYFSWRSAHIYFVQRKAQAFDVSPTYVAIEAGRVHDRPIRGIFAAPGFAASHPPVILFKEKAVMENYYNLAEFLPPSQPSDRDLMLFLVDDYQGAVPYLKSLFPGLETRIIPNTSRVGGADIATVMEVPVAELLRTQGLRTRVLDARGWRDAGGSPVAYNPAFAGAQQVQWRGALVLRHYGSYRFQATTRGRLVVRLNGRTVLNGPQGPEVVLPMGVHAIEVDYAPPSGGEELRLNWTARPVNAGQVFNVRGQLNGEVPVAQLRSNVEPQGFYGRYYASGDWTGRVVTETIEPMILVRWLDSPIAGTWSATWKARLRIDQEGDYAFNVVTAAYAEVLVNGQVVHRGGGPVVPQFNPQPVRSPIRLKPGRHTIEMRFATRGYPWMELRWSGPGIANEVLQGDRLQPLER